MKQHTIIVLEDDPIQCEQIVANLASAFPKYNVIECATESEFRHEIDNIQPGQLGCAVLDDMVPWEFPTETMTIPPAEVQAGGMFRAGKRCMDYTRKMLGEHTPICIHTILDREDAEIESDDEMTKFVGKQSGNSDLIRIVAGLLGHSAGISK